MCTGPSELKLQITIATEKTVADLKQAIADKSDVPADRQRLIYSGASSFSPHMSSLALRSLQAPRQCCFAPWTIRISLASFLS